MHYWFLITLVVIFCSLSLSEYFFNKRLEEKFKNTEKILNYVRLSDKVKDSILRKELRRYW